MGHFAHLSHLGQYFVEIFSLCMHFIFFCGHNKQFHVTCKGGHCLGTPQACTGDLGLGISTAFNILGLSVCVWVHMGVCGCGVCVGVCVCNVPEKNSHPAATPECVLCCSSDFSVLDFGLTAITLRTNNHPTHQAHGGKLAVIAIRAWTPAM
jgi:hypothetical protein